MGSPACEKRRRLGSRLWFSTPVHPETAGNLKELRMGSFRLAMSPGFRSSSLTQGECQEQGPSVGDLGVVAASHGSP